MRRVLGVLLICFISSPLFAYRSSSELINVPSAKMPIAGQVEYGGGVRFFVKDDKELKNYGTAFFTASLSDRFQYGLNVRDDLVALHSFQGQLYSSFNEKKQRGHYWAAGVKNIGYTTPKMKTSDPILDYFLAYSFDLPQIDTTYHLALSYDRADTRKLVFLAGAEYGFFFGKTMIEWDGSALNLGLKFRMAKSEYLYVTVCPTPVTSKERSPEYVSLGYTFTDNIWDKLRQTMVPRSEYEPKIATMDLRLNVLDAKQQALSDLLSTEFLSKIEAAFLRDSENEKFFDKQSKAVTKGAISHMQKGMEFYYQGKFKSARNEYETVVSLLPNYYLGYVRLGSIHYQLGDLAKAREYWVKALTFKVDNLALKAYLERMVGSIPEPVLIEQHEVIDEVNP